LPGSCLCPASFTLHACQHDAAQDWLARQQELLLPVPYFLVTFTLPGALRAVAFQHQALVYDLLVEGVLGIDLGVTNIAVDSDGDIHSGQAINNVRYRHRRLRKKLQQRRTLDSRRRLRSLAGQEARFAKHVNHTISKGIVAKAQRTKRAIAVEDLTHIRTRIGARKSQRVTLHTWSFAQLQAFIVCKALRRGIPVHRVDPRNTSRTCPACGHIAKANRKTQAAFVCLLCGFAGLADRIAAENIRVLGRALVSAPHCSDADGIGSARAKPKPFRPG